MGPPAQATPPQSQFLRFRLNEFQRGGTPSASPAGQCSRFRVSDFVPSTFTQPAAADTPPPAAATAQARPPPRLPAQGGGSYSVLQMDIDSTPQQTSTMVAINGGRGVLHKVAAPPPPPHPQFSAVVSRECPLSECS